MALENYTEMRDAVRDAAFVRRQAIAMALERRFPDRFIPRYSMVMFHPEIPYAEALRRGVDPGAPARGARPRRGAASPDAERAARLVTRAPAAPDLTPRRARFSRRALPRRARRSSVTKVTA